METTVYIYALSDSSGIRYIGKTTDIKRRLTHHFHYAFKQESEVYNYPRSRWIRLRKEEIYLTIIEECNNENWADREKYWIKFYSDKVELLNCTEGGDGNHGYKWTQEQRKSISESRKGRKYSEKAKKAMSDAKKGFVPIWSIGRQAWNKGKKLTPEQRKKVGPPKGRIPWNKGQKMGTPGPRKGVEVSEETRKKMSDSARRRWQKT